MARNFINLDVNPCKMCMPMGAAIAFKGIEKSILMMHGSQGCSTYMRRHMATHYNEPVDIASSSLTEQGTVYGGENNLKKGLRNTIQLYQPKVIGVVTTCLAETIGEDIDRLINEFVAEEEIAKDITFIPVATPGYGGTEYEGYYLSLRKMVERLAEEGSNDKVNIIAGNLTPAEIRRIKEILESFSISYNLLPDISKTLDAPYSKDYQKLPDGGTTIEEIKSMGGAKATIELGALLDEKISAGQFLEDEFRIPLYRVALPIGLANVDKFINALSKVTGAKPDPKLTEARGRMLDAMVDSHKYNAQGRAAIFGQPELVYSIATLCLENGLVPALLATGAKTSKLEELLKKDFGLAVEDTVIIDDTDFDTIRDYVNKLDVNILIGHSDGKFITERDGIPLVRVGFPIHDRVGGQRKVTIGYDGSVNFLDEITNTLLDRKYSSYREDMYDKHFTG
ncbi:nitrogenase molybdenum-iron protein NifN [Orenia metallireducens]|uniref:Nitrogenase molybdenum-iron protein NifN n=1 Tax=Orenia metallireducens TaxID=1413210 RepID=A0A285GGU2_9FIRM|nr:nitrogenase component 1 [Orenia metallireducens]PRX30418.1 nitrogenase molybdenum-iron protein NifN [Orenia metallireducens]SNY22414.1 nitrogenase molybdenum-iron protein NifN [Orenia metallireducens]